MCPPNAAVARAAALHDGIACVVCGTTEKIATCESWAGSFHSACNHAYCASCLEQHVNSQLAKCRTAQHLEVHCAAPGCKKRIPQKWVLSVSVEARMLANVIDLGKDERCCPHCKTHSSWRRIIENPGCKHGACMMCWMQWMEASLPDAVRNMAFDVPCIEPGCTHGCRRLLHHHEIAPEVPSCPVAGALLSHLRFMDSELQRLNDIKHVRSKLHAAAGQNVKAVVTRPDRLVGPTCPVCQEVAVALFADPCCPSHGACETCWTRWAEEQLDICVAHRRLEARCMWPDCPTTLSANLGVWYQAASRSPAVKQLTTHLERRAHLQRNPLYPAPMQVECPKVGCVGMGYLGFDTVMCFMCEHTWLPEESGEKPGIPDVEQVMGVAVKKCPNCKEYIEKNGGCDHMTCVCKHEFYW
eukprot:CAMPEP_0178444362 /NCGR_PEP_ID=MMETSP0689_2-20121128/39451_1 /TAXON_ID=160604 /ORGANISM="Amphidinium massartii, Strain CS-259" /LENGTH=412 /DNA_ID=CAMNT_0020068557 /DNA_START=34 /DNA_END=1269 /DNA_ORIENTATION=+